MRVARWVLGTLAVVHVVEALELRRRRGQLATLTTPGPGAGGGDGAGIDVVTADGTSVDAATRAAVAAEMAATGAGVVDLVPGDLPPDRLLRLLRRLEPAKVGSDPYLVVPTGAHDAVALHPSVAARIGWATDDVTGLDRGDMVRRTLHAQRHAPTELATRLAPGVQAAPATPEQRWRELEEMLAPAWPYGAPASVVVALETLHLAAMTAGFLVAPWAAAAALATWSAQPALVVEGGRGRQASLTRLPRAWADNVRTARAGARATKAKNARRLADPLPAPPPPEALFEPRRDRCPWCGSPEISGRLDITDLLQHKDGEFHLDECRDCGHIFQNPALTITGLDHFYEDAYDGLGEELAETSFAALGFIYRNRVESLARHHEPRAWLDVGTGHAHFCLAARERWPQLTIDGLDMSDTVEEAQRRGRIDTAYRGQFPDLAGSLPRSYDVVSMHHYIEHTREPKAELAAAAKVVEPGGFLMIEMPDPASPWATRLGRYWWQWGQPQHQHFVACDEMVAAVEDVGFDVVSVERGPATMGGDLYNAIGLWLQETVRSPHLPWLPEPGVAHRARRLALYTAALPGLLATKVVDDVKDRVRRARGDRSSAGNAYRIVARRR
jgi:ubiquinone/menaquinone biosynthesis C-methylase UbiE